jgi:lysine 2,3-aminomutase
MLADSISTAGRLSEHLPIDVDSVERVARRYPMRINSYFLSLVKSAGAPLRRQAVPHAAELAPDPDLSADPLDEGPHSPVPHLIHRYPDRVVFMVSGNCAVYCRHCMRKRRVGRNIQVTDADLDRAIGYIRQTPGIREVILSGGDPLLIPDERLDRILSRLSAIAHVELLRVHSRAPCTLPARITSDLALLLAAYQPLFLNIQFNHPAELAPDARAACSRLADAGIPLGSQSVLLKGVNDDPGVMRELMRSLLKNRIRPYYLHHADPVDGTRHFRTSLETGLEILRAMRGRISGMGVPQYMIDLPGGGGKVALLPESLNGVSGVAGDRIRVVNYRGELYTYPVRLFDA